MSTFTKYPASAKWIIGILLLLNILCLAALWFGRPKGPHHHRGHRHLIHQMKQELQFDEQQTVSLDAMIERQKQEQKQLQETIHQMRSKIRLAAAASSVNTDSTSIFAQKLGDLTRQSELKAVQHFVELKNLCNPDQLKKLQDIMESIPKKTAPRE